jgi:hypothetical protein
MPNQDRRSVLKIAAALAASAPALAIPGPAFAGSGLKSLDDPMAVQMASSFAQQYANDAAISAKFDKQFETIGANLSKGGSAEQFASDTKKLCKYVSSIVNPGGGDPPDIIIIIIIIIILVCIPKDAR